MAESPGHVFNRLVEILARLRAPDGCPWDREQTRTSLKPHLIEEAYEVLDALESSDPRHLAEELGDLLFQVMIHAQIASELGEFTIADVLTGLVDKMVSRHPHVFGEASVSTAQEALTQWERLKRREALAAGDHRSRDDDGGPDPSVHRRQTLSAPPYPYFCSIVLVGCLSPSRSVRRKGGLSGRWQSATAPYRYPIDH